MPLHDIEQVIHPWTVLLDIKAPWDVWEAGLAAVCAGQLQPCRAGHLEKRLQLALTTNSRQQRGVCPG